MGAEANQKRASHSYLTKTVPKDENSDSDSEEISSDGASHAEPTGADKLKHMIDTSRNLHGFVITAVKRISKAENAPSWEMLADN